MALAETIDTLWYGGGIEAIIRKQEERRSERRAFILQTASRFFVDNGYSGTTMSAIAAYLGGSKGTLWSYFSSKDELFAACIEEKTEAFRAELVSLLIPAAPLRPAIEDFCRKFISKVRAPPSIALYQLLVAESTRAPEANRLFYERGPGTTEAVLANFLTGHVQARRLQGGTPLEMAQVLISLCMGNSHMQLMLGLSSRGLVASPPEPAWVAGLFFRLYSAEPAVGDPAVEFGI